MIERTVYVIFKRLRFPSGRVIRKYRSRSGRLTENLRLRWMTASREQADEMARALSRGDGAEWHVAAIPEVELLVHLERDPS